ncbi:MAG: carbamoyl phosphate synthase large subunit [Actinomycetota bacterium]
MPRRTDLSTVLVIGSGPIVIGQAAEFDYSGTQACAALRREGLRVVLVNSNPATIMTDPDVADVTYVEPLDLPTLVAIIERERPDALLATLGGQTALNLAVALDEAGVLAANGVELLGVDAEAIRTAEDRQRFKDAMTGIGLESPRSRLVADVETGLAVADELGFPLVLRPSFTLGGAGGGIARDRAELSSLLARGLADSPVGEVLVEESVLGWKEFELEVMRDQGDDCVLVCSIENLDPMGVHTGDSITVAPAQTLSDPELQRMRDAAFAVLRRIGVATGGANVQFAVDPRTGRQLVIEMNPRVSRSSALASKATGYPIAAIAALLAIGYRLHELVNGVTGTTPVSFEPSLDYVVVKVPRFAFEKFPSADTTLTTTMRSVGEAMAFGSTFREALNKALRSREDGGSGFGSRAWRWATTGDVELEAELVRPHPDRLDVVAESLRRGWGMERVAAATAFDPWFVDQFERLIERHGELVAAGSLTSLDDGLLRESKREGISDAHLAELLATDETAVRAHRLARDVRIAHRTVDTCAAEFEARTPYHYGTYGGEDEVVHDGRRSVVVLGSGPNRIGQGVEFDNCCVHAVQTLSRGGWRTVMVNCNPETVSTDHDVADVLYFEPLTLEDVLAVCDRERPVGVLVQFGGQTPLALAEGLQRAGVPILGTPPDAIDAAEDRGRFGASMEALGLTMPEGAIAHDVDEGVAIARRIGLPVLVRPSYVLGGRAMRLVERRDALERELEAAFSVGGGGVLVDRFLEDAIELDVDAVFDGTSLLVGGILEHIEEAGVHSGDSASVTPPVTLSAAQEVEVRRATLGIARALGVVGLINVQFALKGETLFCLEANPRASRTVPFLSKTTGIPLAGMAALVAAGSRLGELVRDGVLAGVIADPDLDDVLLPVVRGHVAVKEAVLPFGRFAGTDPVLGPEMRSTGEVMGIAAAFGDAFARSQAAAGAPLPQRGRVFVSVADRDKRAIVLPAARLVELGFALVATPGTARVLHRAGIAAETAGKVSEGDDSIVRLLSDGSVGLVLNTPYGSDARGDGAVLRTAALAAGVPCITTIAGIRAAIQGIEAERAGSRTVRSLQEHLGRVAPQGRP